MIPKHVTLDDLMRCDGKVELFRGDIVHFQPLGAYPGLILSNLACSLFSFTGQSKIGDIYLSTIVYGVPILSSGRESFSPEMSLYSGQSPENPMSYLPGPPNFAIELTARNAEDFRSEEQLAAKRADYFEAGTLVVWEIDPLARCVCAYKNPVPQSKQVFSLGQFADAEPAIPGWRIEVDKIFAL